MSKYAVGLKLYTAVRDDFMNGKSAREIGLEHSMEPIHILGFLKWIKREFEIERLIRSDQLKGKLLRVANNLASKAAKLSEEDCDPAQLREIMDSIDKIHEVFAGVSKEDREFMKSRNPRKPTADTGSSSDGHLDDVVSGNGQEKRGRQPGRVAR